MSSAAPLRLVPADAPAPSSDPSDDGPSAEGLVAAAAGGDVRAFATLVARYHPRALRFAVNLGLGREDAEEAVQDAFVRVHRALPRFEPGARFEPWFFRILANQCRSTGGRGTWWRRHATADDAALATVPTRDPDPWETDAAALRDRVNRALAGLPRDQREAFLLRHVEGLEYDEMMQVTGARGSALRMRVKRACDALRARLSQEEWHP